MTHVLVGFSIIGLLELGLWLPPIWRHLRRPLACVLIVIVSSFSGWLISNHFGLISSLVIVASAYRVINLLRLVENRHPLDYMAKVTLRTSLLLIIFQLVLLIIGSNKQHFSIQYGSFVTTLVLVDFIAAALLWLQTRKNIQLTAVNDQRQASDRQTLPTVSVAIPARNETEDLKACLDSLILSTYPKLEILVLDDCSQNKHTPAIIKDFAHAGVRFIAGKTPPEQWLAKNYAYEQLAAEASGDILLFCGVDTRFEPQSLENMVATMRSKNTAMLSIVPQNVLPKEHTSESAILQPIRYAWELALPRTWLQRPPVLSTCWLVRAELLNANGGFKAITHSIAPESYFARAALKAHGSYSFLRNYQLFGLTSQKATLEQRATAIRTRYPQTHRRPEIVAALGLLELLFLVVPYALVVHALIDHQVILFLLSALNVILISTFYSVLVKATYGRFLLRSLVLLPIAVVYDVCLLNYSMWRYEFNEVIWKGRNVCIPLMQSRPSPESSQ